MIDHRTHRVASGYRGDGHLASKTITCSQSRNAIAAAMMQFKEPLITMKTHSDGTDTV